jgi:hypothetical protein
MTGPKDPSLMSAPERLEEVAALLAAGYLRTLAKLRKPLAASAHAEPPCAPRLRTKETAA